MALGLGSRQCDMFIVGQLYGLSLYCFNAYYIIVTIFPVSFSHQRAHPIGIPSSPHRSYRRDLKASLASLNETHLTEISCGGPKENIPRDWYTVYTSTLLNPMPLASHG